MKSYEAQISQEGLQDKIHKAKGMRRLALAEAAETDSVNLFPEKTLETIQADGLLTAAVPAAYGGRDLGIRPGTNLALLKILKHVGAGNLVMGRVLEGHINAQLLISQYGNREQQERFAQAAAGGQLSGVWNTQANDGTFLTQKDGGWYLNGAKTFATGLGYVTLPVVTAALPDGGWQMCIVPLNEVPATIDKSWWNPMGMRATRSYKIYFKDAPVPAENLLGPPGAYYEQPGFSGGAARFAAVQLGAAETLLDETANYLRSLNRTGDPFQRTRMAQMSMAVASGNGWLEGTARLMDEYMLHTSPETGDRYLAWVNLMRSAIEQICLDVMTLCEKCVGARGLNKPYHVERIIRDLTTYLRQPAPDAALVDAGRWVLEQDRPFSDLWTSSEPNS